MKTEKLKPTNGQASFYGKALVLSFDDGWKYLKSYETIMAGISPGGRLKRFSGRRSQTTSRHLNSFLDTYVDSAMNAKEFYGIDIEYPDEHPELGCEQ